MTCCVRPHRCRGAAGVVDTRPRVRHRCLAASRSSLRWRTRARRPSRSTLPGFGDSPPPEGEPSPRRARRAPWRTSRRARHRREPHLASGTPRFGRLGRPPSSPRSGRLGAGASLALFVPRPGGWRPPRRATSAPMPAQPLDGWPCTSPGVPCSRCVGATRLGSPARPRQTHGRHHPRDPGVRQGRDPGAEHVGGVQTTTFAVEPLNRRYLGGTVDRCNRWPSPSGHWDRLRSGAASWKFESPGHLEPAAARQPRIVPASPGAGHVPWPMTPERLPRSSPGPTRGRRRPLPSMLVTSLTTIRTSVAGDRHRHGAQAAR
jgi:hypothetical protein